jgi:hypothetical protein
MIRKRLLAAACIAVVALATTVGTASAAPTNDRAQTLSYVSQPGDYVGQGHSDTFTPGTVSGMTMTMSFLFYNHNSVQIDVARTSPTNWYGERFTLNLEAPAGEKLRVGTYTNAMRAPFETGTSPGLSFYGDGRGCNTVTGSFTITGIRNSGSTIIGVSGTFTQVCDNSTGALTGSFSYNV